MTSFTLPTIESHMAIEQKELIVIQATAQIVCCALEAAVKNGQIDIILDGADFPERPFPNLIGMIKSVKGALSS